MSARIRVTPVPRFIPVTAVPRVAVATLHVGTLSGPARLIGQPAESDGVLSAGFRREVRAVRGAWSVPPGSRAAQGLM